MRSIRVAFGVLGAEGSNAWSITLSGPEFHPFRRMLDSVTCQGGGSLRMCLNSLMEIQCGGQFGTVLL